MAGQSGKLRQALAHPAFRKLLGAGLAGLIIKVLAAVLSLAMFTMLARVMTTGDYGTFGFVFSLATLLAVAGSFGLRMSILKEAAVLFDNGDLQGLRQAASEKLLLVVLGCFAFSAGISLLGSTGLIALSLHQSLTLVGLTIALGLGEYVVHYFRGYRSVAFSLVPRDLLWRIAVLLYCSALALGDLQSGALAALWFTAISLAVLCGVQFFAGQPAGGQFGARGFRATGLVSHIRGARHLWGTSMIQTVGGPVLAPVLLGLLMTPQDVGPFFAAMRIALVMELFTMAASLAIAPLVAKHAQSGEKRGLQRALSQSVLLVSSATCVTFCAILLWGDNALAFMNPDFASAAPALYIFAAGYFIAVLCGPIPKIMELSGLETALFSTLVKSNLIALVLLVPLIYLFGATGAALCLTGLRVFIHVFLLFRVRQRLGVDPSIISWRKFGDT